jgi:hypothetical protein
MVSMQNPSISLLYNENQKSSISLLYNENQKGSSWSWSYGSYIYNYLYNQRVSHQSWDLESRSWRDVLNTALCDDVCQLHAAGRWYSPGIPVSPRVGMLYLPLKEHVAFCSVIKDEDNIGALSKNKMYFCEVLKQVHVEQVCVCLYRSEFKWLIYFPTVYVNGIYRTIWKVSQTLG